MGKIIKLKDIEPEIKAIKHQGKTIVLAGGCFDIIHKGHKEFLKKAKDLGDVLFIILESDETVKKLKGNNRPINKQQTRAELLSEVEFIDYIILIPHLINDLEYMSLVKTVKPDIIAITNGDPAENLKKAQAESVGAKVIPVLERLAGYSTTEIINAQKAV